jgi:hypothetical protein
MTKLFEPSTLRAQLLKDAEAKAEEYENGGYKFVASAYYHGHASTHELIVMLAETLETIAHTIDTAPEDPLGGPCRMYLSMTRNRRIEEARAALEKLRQSLGGE